MEIEHDTRGQPYTQWTKGRNKEGEDCEQRAWIQHRVGENDWAGTGRYLNVVRCNFDGTPGGNATDFPIFNKELTDEQVLLAFVHLVDVITCPPTEG